MNAGGDVDVGIGDDAVVGSDVGLCVVEFELAVVAVDETLGEGVDVGDCCCWNGGYCGIEFCDD